jgi:hypothetical protein
LKDDIKKELDEMVANGIITKINEAEPTNAVNNGLAGQMQLFKLKNIQLLSDIFSVFNANNSSFQTVLSS